MAYDILHNQISHRDIIMRLLIKSIIGTLLIYVLSACVSPTLYLNFTASQQINTSAQQAQLPLALKLYQLSSPQRFKQADFQELWLQDRHALGDTLLDKTLIILKPGEKRKLTISKTKDAKFIGIVAISQHRPGKQWRLLQAIPQTRWLIPGNLNVFVDQGRLTLQ